MGSWIWLGFCGPISNINQSAAEMCYIYIDESYLILLKYGSLSELDYFHWLPSIPIPTPLMLSRMFFSNVSLIKSPKAVFLCWFFEINVIKRWIFAWKYLQPRKCGWIQSLQLKHISLLPCARFTQQTRILSEISYQYQKSNLWHTILPINLRQPQDQRVFSDLVPSIEGSVIQAIIWQNNYKLKHQAKISNWKITIEDISSSQYCILFLPCWNERHPYRSWRFATFMIELLKSILQLQWYPINDQRRELLNNLHRNHLTVLILPSHCKWLWTQIPSTLGSFYPPLIDPPWCWPIS